MRLKSLLVAKALMCLTKAGNDLILASQLNVTEGVEIRQTLVDAVKSGEINRRDFDEATRRIVELRSRAWN